MDEASQEGMQHSKGSELPHDTGVRLCSPLHDTRSG